MRLWYCHLNGKNYGPYPEDQMRDISQAGKITPDTLVYCADFAEQGWVKAGEAKFNRMPEDLIQLPPIPTNYVSKRKNTKAKFLLLCAACGIAAVLLVVFNFTSISSTITRIISKEPVPSVDDWKAPALSLNDWLAVNRDNVNLAIREGRVDVLGYLQEQGFIVKEQGFAFMHLAAREGQLEVMKWLKEQGSDVNHKSSVDGRFPMLNAAGAGQIEAMKWLKEQGCDINEEVGGGGGGWYQGSRPIHFAAMGGHLEAVKWLKEQGADINIKNQMGSLMHNAVGARNIELLEWLKKEGADINARDDQWGTPLRMARHGISGVDMAETIQWLENNGAIE